ncbi:RNA-directed DNA polymerase, eukaryota [Tanacetum coccineum]
MVCDPKRTIGLRLRERKNRGNKTKEDDLVKVHSNADLTRTISKSIFVTNFPDNTTSADLWNICQTYGVVVDVYIPNRRSKVGLGLSVCPIPNQIFLLGIELFGSMLKVSLCTHGLVTRFIRLVPCGVKFWNLATARMNASRVKGYALKPIVWDIFLEKFKIIVKGKSFVVRAKELFVWSPSFVEVTEADDIHEEGEFIQIGEEGLEKPIHQNDVVGRECIEASANNVDDQFSGEYRKTYRKRKKVVLSWRILERDDIGRSNHGFLDGRRTKGYEKSRGHGDQSPTPPLWSAMYLGRFYMKSGGKEERWGSTFNVYGARDFNHFITSVGLVEVQLEGYSYTWAHPSASKMSKLDRFLVSDGFLSLFPHTSAVCLDRHLSDHRPILLREFNTDYGATPFRLFHSWFDFQGFDDMITQTWNLLSQDSNAMGSLQKNSGSQKNQLGANDDLLSVRSELLKQYHDIHSVETREKRANLAVKGVMIDGEWVDDPSKVKDEFRDYFASRFCDPGIRHAVEKNGSFLASFPVGCNSSFIALIPKTLNPKSVGEYRPISLIGSIYKIVTKILANRLSTVIADIFERTNRFLPTVSNFGWPFFIINELLARCHHKKHSAMVFKIDFAKAYDSIRWDYLGDVLKSFGFGVKWCSWIRGILNSSMASILVNGSPTKEFQFHRGLKQGDPLAPYLFIIIMESLHLSFSRVIEAGIFTVFIGEWSRGNLTGIMHTLRCFSLLSGLSINLKKSQLLGVGIPESQVLEAATLIGCSVLHTPFKYLGIMVGENMSSIRAWDETVNKLKMSLSSWKLKTLSIGGRLTLLKSKKIAWVSWSKVLASKSNGGLGVSSFYALNRGLLFKWIWRFLSRDQSLWAQGIQALPAPTQVLFLPPYSSLWEVLLLRMYALKSKRWKESAQLLGISDLLDTVVLLTGGSSVWDLNRDGCFRVKDVRRLLDDMLLPKSDVPSRWVKQIPIKVNVLAWEDATYRCLPTSG